MKSTPAENNCLVALLPTLHDLTIAQTLGWYRIPIGPAPEIVKSGNLKFLAFYLPKIFGKEAFQVKYFVKITSINIKHRTEIFPEEPINSKSSKQYYVLHFDGIETLKTPIISNKPRRILFVPTTEFKLFHAKEINDVFNASPLEEIVWESLIQRKIAAERQYSIEHRHYWFLLDFAIFCTNGNINIECDGDKFHTEPKHVKFDKSRNNILAGLGWNVLRFTTDDIQNRLDESMQHVHDSIRSNGGMRFA